MGIVCEKRIFHGNSAEGDTQKKYSGRRIIVSENVMNFL
jgi:hypothetical protein